MRPPAALIFTLLLLSGALGWASGTKPWATEGWLDTRPPEVHDAAWIRNPIDRFVLAKLEKEGLKPSPEAAPEVLLARLHHSITGLPPSAGQRAGFLAEPNPARLELAMERLLADPAYGERWARHWLDIARYADSKGYVFLEDRHLHFAWTYRDWVIDSLNRDIPYDRFVREQIAADKLHPEGGPGRENLAALGFLTVGRRFLNNQHDILDDRIDVVTRGLLGLTVACARCHDHKNDPVTMEDYYSLYAVLAASREPDDLPLLGTGSLTPAEQAFQAEQKRRDDAVDDYVRRRRGDLIAGFSRPEAVAPHLLAATADTALQTDLAREHDLNPTLVARWREFLSMRPDLDPLWSTWKALAPASGGEWNKAVMKRRQEAPKSPAWAAGLLEPAPATHMDLARRVAALLSAAAKGDPALATYRAVLAGPGGPLDVPPEQTGKLLGRDDRDAQRDLQRQADEWRAITPPALARAMALEDIPDPPRARVFKRGNPLRQGAEIPKRFVACLANGSPISLGSGSGRLELANAITRPDHPLLARVVVNRVWMHHFGEGLIRTPGDFGARGEEPTHPGLLDWLARDLIANGWSLKRLHRQILGSATWRQSSARRGDLETRDPENRLLARQNLRRIDWETLRDKLLLASGSLDAARGGPPEPVLSWPWSGRRTIYTYVERQNAPGAPRAFDAASPDTSTPRRFETLTAAQGLFLLNSPFVIEQAAGMARRARMESDPVTALFRIAWGRDPTSRELIEAGKFLGQPLPARVAAPSAWACGQARVKDDTLIAYAPLSRFTGSAWQATPLLPAPGTGKMHLTSTGGHPPSDHPMVVVRRFTAPADMTVNIAGTLDHPDYRGDGVRAWLAGPGGKVIASWKSLHGEVATTAGPIRLGRGQSLDFAVGPGENPGYDSFLWAPVVTDAETGATHDAARGFPGPAQPPPTPLAQLAQTLVLGNPFHFVE
ncbi:MAG: DUF1549 and DUF1553 domain-containing protein [Planctomycetota bacterium]